MEAGKQLVRVNGETSRLINKRVTIRYRESIDTRSINYIYETKQISLKYIADNKFFDTRVEFFSTTTSTKPRPKVLLEIRRTIFDYRLIDHGRLLASKKLRI